MRNSSKIKFGVGVLIWIGLIVFAAVGIRHSRSVSPHAVENLGTYLSAKRKSIDIVSPHHVVIGIGDPLFMKNDGVLNPLGW